MTTRTRKQREIAAREEQILDEARRLLLDRGYHGLSMDRVAEATEYSKGTVYNHFKSKEDLLVGLAIQTADRRLDFLSRAATFNGRSRERMLAVGLAYDLFVALYPDHFRSEHVIHVASVRDRADRARSARLAAADDRCFHLVTGIVRDAVAQGDLVLPDDLPAGHVSFTLWAMSFGAYFLDSSEVSLADFQIDSRGALRRGTQALLDGYGWRPLFAEWDWEASTERILSEVFPEESRALRA